MSLSPCLRGLRFEEHRSLRRGPFGFCDGERRFPSPKSNQVSLTMDGKKVESESNVLLAYIENMQYVVTLDVLHMVFSAFGPVLKIAMFDKNGGVQALIQYPDVQTAIVAKEALEGHCIYDGGFCKLHITYSLHTDLSIKCKVCMQTFICTTSEAKCKEHAEAKHPKVDLVTCFPI